MRRHPVMRRRPRDVHVHAPVPATRSHTLQHGTVARTCIDAGPDDTLLVAHVYSRLTTQQGQAAAALQPSCATLC
jgi:hypothetical protein